MTEYWKSQARKYCEFCKCWFADNKVSISFHENGKKHKENVQKHISQLSKKSAKDFKKQEKIDDEMKKMEAAAMAAYLKDVQNNADLTSQSINNMLGKSGSTSADLKVGSSNTSDAQTKKEPIWHETKHDDNSTYFWNTVTNETTWDPPDEYLSLAQQEKKKMKAAEEAKKKEKLKKQKQEESVKELKAHLAREKMKELAASPLPASSAGPTPLGPAPRARPYGSWTPILQSTSSIDLQLPKIKQPAAPPVVLEPEEPTLTFAERRVESLGDVDEPVEFKKRKFNNPKRNIRQKTNDD